MEDRQVMAFFLGVVVVVLWVIRFVVLNKTTATRPDGSTVDASKPTTADGEEPAVRQKRQLGPTTMSFHFISQRHTMVNNLKQKYGNAVRIIHRGKQTSWDLLVGNQTVYTLIYEVPAKCPSCKDSFSIDDFGFIDCPTCHAELAVYFDTATRKKIVQRLDGQVIVEQRPPSRAANAGREPQLHSEQEPEGQGAVPSEADRLAARFGKLE